MYKFGDIISYKTKNSGRNIYLVVISDIDGYIHGLTFERKLKKFKRDPERYLVIPKTKLKSKRFYYVNARNVMDVNSSSVNNEDASLSKKSIHELRKKIEYLVSKKAFSKKVLSKIEYSDKLKRCSTRTEPESSEQHLLSLNELFPNGTGRTKEEFERDNANIHKKFALQYKQMINKQR